MSIRTRRRGPPSASSPTASRTASISTARAWSWTRPVRHRWSRCIWPAKAFGKGDCRLAIAGGVNAFLSPVNAIAFSKMGVLSPDGRCKAFDSSANGFVRAEGAGAILLKPLSRALADGDRIYAVIQATGVNQDGVTNGLAVPNGAAQAALIRETFARSGLDPQRVAYIEAHGTGTAVGDPTEAHAIGHVIGAGRSQNPGPIGSVKTNLGHLESAAGIAGLIKAALVLHKRTIPPNLHFHTPNPHIDFAALGLEVITKTRSLCAAGRTADGTDETHTTDVSRGMSRSELRSAERPDYGRPSAPPAGPAIARFELRVPRTGTIDRLRYREAKPVTPRGDQLEVRVIAAGLNFRDVLKVLGLYPMDGDYLTLGDECAGIVERVGDDVTEFQPGDEVICVGGPCFATHVVTAEHLTMLKPAQLMFEEAATLPIAFLTAHYCLHEVARLQPGERVLIHAAAGGVGLAAIQIAQKVGAEVFATASERKQEFVKLLGVEHVMDSRSLDFAAQIEAITGGRGVDVILNSLAGEAIPKSLSILARYGRFVEIGKRDLYENRKIGLGYFREGISFHSVDLSRVMIDKPDLIRRMRRSLIDDFQSGKLRPLPHRIFAANRIRDAFRTMAEAKHVGKIVVSFRQPQLRVEPAIPESPAFVADASYLITGGCGGFGLEIARAMLANGARNLILLGRSDVASDKARHAIARLESFPNARVAVMQADVGDHDALATAFARIQREFPPLRGVVHAAGVLEDGPLVQLNAASFQRVMSPKVHGLWNLHELTKQIDLDFFLLTSSSSSLLGNPGQANYAAANSLLDTFVHYRRTMGLPATVVNFGPLADAGMVARDQSIGDRMARLGVATLPSQKAIEFLRAVQLRNRPQVGALRVRWSRWLDAMGFAEVPSKILDVYAEDDINTSSDQASGELRQSLLMAPAEGRLGLVSDYRSGVVARVLGTSAENLDRYQPLQTLGLDSLTTVELCNRLENDLRITVPLAELAKQPSLTQLSEVLLSLLPLGDSKPADKTA